MTHVARNAGILIVVMVALVSCDGGGKSTLQGQPNTTMTFYGLAVDQDGAPLEGVHLRFRVEAYPKDWSFETRGRDKDFRFIDVTSDKAGTFSLPVTACGIIKLETTHKGYKELYDLDTSDGTVRSHFIRLISWGELQYKTDSDHPAVFVFVKDGISKVSALPSRGGWNNAGGTRWTLNKPAWPTRPSLKEVVQNEPTTGPARDGGPTGP
jgi:hypothetical protein